MAFRRVVNGTDNMNDVDVDQYADAFNGVGGKAQPMDLIQLDQDRYYVVVKNLNANSKCQQVYKADGTLLFQIDGNGVKASPDGIASAAALPPSASPTLTGTINLSGRVLRRRTSTLAAAGTVTLPSDGDVIPVSGTATITTINPIALVGLTGQAVVTLEFQSVGCKVARSASLRLHGDFVSAIAGATLTLECDGTNWNEVGRAGGGVQGVLCPFTGQTLTDNAADAQILLNAGTYDRYGIRSTNQLVARWDGTYLVSGSLAMAANNVGNRTVLLYKNATSVAMVSQTASPASGKDWACSWAVRLSLVTNDAIDVRAAISGVGGGLAVRPGSNAAGGSLSMDYLGPA